MNVIKSVGLVSPAPGSLSQVESEYVTSIGLQLSRELHTVLGEIRSGGMARYNYGLTAKPGVVKEVVRIDFSTPTMVSITVGEMNSSLLESVSPDTETSGALAVFLRHCLDNTDIGSGEMTVIQCMTRVVALLPGAVLNECTRGGDMSHHKEYSVMSSLVVDDMVLSVALAVTTEEWS